MIYLPDDATCPYCGETENLDYINYVIDSDGNYYRIFCHSCNEEFVIYDEFDEDEDKDN